MIEFSPNWYCEGAKAVALGMLQSMEQTTQISLFECEVTWKKTGGDAMLWAKVREFGSKCLNAAKRACNLT